MKKLSMIDWAFLQMETPKQLAHVAGLWIFQLPKGYRGHFFRDLQEGLTDWQRVSPPFNFKLEVPVPKLDLPSWIEDEQFDLDHHVHYARLPKPGTQAQLLEWVEQLHSQMLDRSRPLWDIHFIEGVQGRRVAIYCKIHHALVDGITGLNLMVNTFCQSAEARVTRTLWQPPCRPSPENPRRGLMARAGKAYADTLGQLRSLPELTGSLAKAGLQGLKLRENKVPLPFTAPKTLLNAPVSAQRRLAIHTLSLTAVKTLSKVADATVNDIVLAVCSGALRRYLSTKQALPVQPLVAFMPVSTRSTQDGQAGGGNQVVAVLSSLATTQDDPRQRFAAIQSSANAAKLQFSEQSAETTNHTILLFGGVLMLTQQLGMSKRLAPPANVVISNVPGPSQTLYLNGAELLAQYPLSMLIDGLALNITITGHADNLDFGVVACREALPDADVLAEYLGDAFAELQDVLTKPIKPMVEGAQQTLAPRQKPVSRLTKISQWPSAQRDKVLRILNDIPLDSLKDALQGRELEQTAVIELTESLDNLDKALRTMKTTLLPTPKREGVNGPDPQFMQAQAGLWNLLVDYYFRVEIEGWERLPARPSLLIGGHSGGALTMDAWTVVWSWWRRFGKQRILHGTAHDALMNLPGLGAYFRRSGVISPFKESIAAAFAAGHDVILWPGGEVDSFRSWNKRDQIVLAGRKGFIRLAIREQVPIVPVATIGGHDTFFVLSEGRGLAKMLGLKKHFRTDVAPITLSVPFGITLEPLPTHIPLPAKIRTEFLEPVELDTDPERVNDNEYVDKMYHEIEGRIQAGVNRLAQRRRFVVFG